MTAVHDIYIKSKFIHFFIVKFTPDMVSGNELYKYIHRVNSLMFMVKFTLNIVSRTELPAVYQVNLLNPIDRICSHH